MEDIVLKDIVEVLFDNKANDIVYVDVSNVNPLTNYYIICSASSSRQASALAKYADDVLTKHNITTKHIEGNAQSEWILLDGNDYIVHIFVNEARYKYNLEKMWPELKFIKVG